MSTGTTHKSPVGTSMTLTLIEERWCR